MFACMNVDNVSIPILCDVKCLQNLIKTNKFKLSFDLKKHLLEILISELNAKQKRYLWEKLCSEEIVINESCEYDVEDILDDKTIEGETYYLVKWKGWPSDFNEWLNEKQLNCESLLSNYKNNLHPCLFNKNDIESFVNNLFINSSPEKDLLIECCKIVEVFKKSLLPKRLARLTKFQSLAYLRINNSRSKPYKEQKELQLDMLKDWEKHINKVEKCRSHIYVENEVDMAGPPEDFIYIDKRIAGDGVELDDATPSFGCLCQDCYKEKNTCCASHFDSKFAYYKTKKLRFKERYLIVECNALCKCGSECPNRVVQNGRRYKLSIFRTSNGKGWGVKTLELIKKGSFVIEYIGEVITNDEAEMRGLQYDNEGMTYLFDLDFPDYDLNEYSIDAKIYGNASHFINHSCDPNLNVYPVLDNIMNIKQHRLCFFANRNIMKGEELSFDYCMRVDSNEDNCDTISSNSLTSLTSSLISCSTFQDNFKNLKQYPLNLNNSSVQFQFESGLIEQSESKKNLMMNNNQLGCNESFVLPSTSLVLDSENSLGVKFYSNTKKRHLTTSYADRYVNSIKKIRRDFMSPNFAHKKTDLESFDASLIPLNGDATYKDTERDLCLISIENFHNDKVKRVAQKKTIDDYFGPKLVDSSPDISNINKDSVDAVRMDISGNEDFASVSVNSSFDQFNKLGAFYPRNNVAVPCFCGSSNCKGYITKFIRNT